MGEILRSERERSPEGRRMKTCMVRESLLQSGGARRDHMQVEQVRKGLVPRERVRRGRPKVKGTIGQAPAKASEKKSTTAGKKSDSSTCRRMIEKRAKMIHIQRRLMRRKRRKAPVTTLRGTRPP